MQFESDFFPLKLFYTFGIKVSIPKKPWTRKYIRKIERRKVIENLSNASTTKIQLNSIPEKKSKRETFSFYLENSRVKRQQAKKDVKTLFSTSPHLVFLFLFTCFRLFHLFISAYTKFLSPLQRAVWGGTRKNVFCRHFLIFILEKKREWESGFGWLSAKKHNKMYQKHVTESFGDSLSYNDKHPEARALLLPSRRWKWYLKSSFFECCQHPSPHWSDLRAFPSYSFANSEDYFSWTLCSRHWIRFTTIPVSWKWVRKELNFVKNTLIK